MQVCSSNEGAHVTEKKEYILTSQYFNNKIHLCDNDENVAIIATY